MEPEDLKIASTLLNLNNSPTRFDKTHLYAKNPYETKYQSLINKREGVGLNSYNDSKAFIEYSNYRMISVENPKAPRDSNIFLIGCIIMSRGFIHSLFLYRSQDTFSFYFQQRRSFYFLQYYFLFKSQNFTLGAQEVYAML